MKKVIKITLWVVAIVVLCLAILQIYSLFEVGLVTPNNSLLIVLKIIIIICLILAAALVLLTIKVKPGRFPKIYPKLLFSGLFLSGIVLVISGLLFFGGNPLVSKLGIPGASICLVFGIFDLVLGINIVLSKTPKEEKLEEGLE